MAVPDEIRALCDAVPWPPDEPRPSGATDKQIEAAEMRMGIKFPPEFRAFLCYLNGPRIGPGGILGVGVDRAACDICHLLNMYPHWKSRRWIPVAGDGCGNYFVLVTCDGKEPPVGFVDTMAAPNEIAYVVASDFWHFLDFLLKRELGKTGWPFTRDVVIRADPGILDCESAKLPWEAES